VPELVAFSRENLKHSLRDDDALLSATSIIQSDGKATKALGLEAAGGGEQFDCIHVGVAVETKAEAEQFLDFLKPGGGLLIPLGFANAEQKLVKVFTSLPCLLLSPDH
jgi:protein-L-isoaspartate O-methyltransferase